MRFELEKEDASGNACNSATRYVTPAKVRVNNRETLSLPTTSYVIIDEPTYQHFKVFDLRYGAVGVLNNNLFQALQLKLERTGNDDKLALVTSSGEPYYYYHDYNDVSYSNIGIATIDFIPQPSKDGEFVRVYDYDVCSTKFKSLESSKVLIDPKDIISSKNISLVLENLKNSPNNRLEIRVGEKFSKGSSSKLYRSVEVHDSTGSKVGILNNVVPYFRQISGNFHLFPFYGGLEKSYFTAEKLGNNYVGCISDEKSKCKNFYGLKPDFAGYNSDNNSGSYPYYYNLENFGNFLEVDVVNIREFEDLKAEVQYLKEQVERLIHREQVEGMPGLPGFPGQKGERGDPGSDAKPEDVAAILLSSEKRELFGEALFRMPSTLLKGKTFEDYITQEMPKNIANDRDFRERIKGEKGGQGLKGEVGSQGPVGPKGERGDTGIPGEPGQAGIPGLRGHPGERGDIGDQGSKGPQGIQGEKGERGGEGRVGQPGHRGAPGLPGSEGPKGLTGPKGDKGNTGPEGPKGVDGASGPKGPPGLAGPKGEPGTDGIGAAVANQFLSEMNKTKLEIQDAQKATEVAKNTSENFAKKAQSAKDHVTKLHTEVVNSTKEAKAFSEEAGDFADRAAQSQENTQQLYSETKNIFCKTKPTDQVCTARRKKREIKNLNDQPVTSGVSRPTSFISQVINFFYPSVGQDKYKVENKIQELNQVVKIVGAAKIITKFEKVLEETASNYGIPKQSLNFNPVELQSAIVSKSLFNDENRNELLKFLCVAAEKACPNYKQTGNFLTTFKGSIKRTLANNEQLSNTKEIVTGNEQPRSFMSDVVPLSSLSAINQKVVGYLR